MSGQGISFNDIPEQYHQLIATIGLDATVSLCNTYGGESVYIPKVDKLMTAKRNEDIRKEYNGYNIKKLARKHNLTIQSIRLVLQGSGPAPIDGQINMSDIITYP